VEKWLHHLQQLQQKLHQQKQLQKVEILLLRY
jgi:hypothetical protein